MALPALQTKLEQLDSFAIESVREVCSTMLNWQLDDGTPIGDGQPGPFELNEFNGCIGFGGKMTGGIVLSCPEALAQQMARTILGTDFSSGARDLSDVVGEIANMVSGDMKRRKAELGYNGLLAPPLVMTGDGIVVESKDAPIAADNHFRIPEIKEELGVRVFARLDA